MDGDNLQENHKESIINNILTLKSQQRFRSGKDNVFNKEKLMRF